MYYSLNLVLSNPEDRFDFRDHQDFIEEKIKLFNKSKKRNPKAISNFLITANMINLELESAIELEMPIKAIRTFTKSLLQNERFRQAVYKNTLFKSLEVTDVLMVKNSALELPDNEKEQSSLSANHRKGDSHMHELKVMEWNINQRYISNTPAMVIIEIVRQNADVIVLTEFYKTPNYFDIIVKPLQEYGYCVFLDSRPAKVDIRQILIAIRKNILSNQYIEPQKLPDNEENIKDGVFPNFLRVDFIIEDIPIAIIGTRIRVWQNSGKDEQLRRKNQFLELLKQIPKDREVIILGDMNISDNPEYKKKNSEWHYDKIYEQFYKEDEKDEEDKNLILCVPQKGNSPIGSKWKLDHLIISKGISLEEKPLYVEDVSWPKGINYPDHAILTATIKIKTNNLK